MSKLDRNGYAPSIVQEEPFNTDGMVRHEIYYGVKCRAISKREGFWLYLWPAEHSYLHDNPDTGIDKRLKQKCQSIFEETHSREEFEELIGRSYL